MSAARSSYFTEFDDFTEEDLILIDKQQTNTTITCAAAAVAVAARSPPLAAASTSAPVVQTSFATSFSGPTSTSSPLYQRAIALLKQYFGYSSFRIGQFEMLSAVLSHNRDAFALIATGGGKSVCFQLLPLISNRTVIVISPLISLMQDQVIGLKAKGISACALTSHEADPQVARDAMNGSYNLIYMSPERLMGSIEALKSLQSKKGIVAFAIDEAHCCTEWSANDFRPEYGRLGCIRDNFPSIPLVALTATATPKVRDEIRTKLQLINPLIVQTTFNRPNLFHEVRLCASLEKDITKDLLCDGNESCIVYVQTKADAENIARFVRDKLGIEAQPYHAALRPSVRQSVHESFMRDELRCVVSTIAFGMGLDAREIRRVVVYGMTKSLESYVQMAGRAGRDGLEARCTLFYSKQDFGKMNFWKNSNNNSSAGNFGSDSMEERLRKESLNRALDKMSEYISSTRCRRIFMLSYFGENWAANALPPGQSQKGSIDSNGNCSFCDNCLQAMKENQSPTMNAASSSNSTDGSQVTIQDVSVEHIHAFALCLREIGGRFGMSLVIQILKGSKSKKLLEKNSWFSRQGGLAGLKSYGMLSNESVSYLQALGRFLINITVAQWHYQNEFQLMKLGHEGIKLLAEGVSKYKIPQGILTPELRLELEGMRKSKLARAVSSSIDAAASAHHASILSSSSSSLSSTRPLPLEIQLLNLLLDLRIEISRAKGIPPYTIFARSELEVFSKYRPITTQELAKVAGVTDSKIAAYGVQFCECIKDFALKHQLTCNVPLPTDKEQVEQPVTFIDLSSNAMASDATSSLFSPLKTAAPSTSISSAKVLSYTSFLSRYHHNSDPAKKLPSIACSWHSFSPGVITRVNIPATARAQSTTAKRLEACQLWNQGHDLNSVAVALQVDVTKVINWLSESIELDGHAYSNWHRYNIPDSAVDRVQEAILTAHADMLKTGANEVLRDVNEQQLWSVPFLRRIRVELHDAEEWSWDVLRLVVNHLRRVYGPDGPRKDEGVANLTPAIMTGPAQPAAAAASSVSTILQRSSSGVTGHPAGSTTPKMDLGRFMSKYSPVKQEQQAVKQEREVPVPSVPRRNLSDFLHQHEQHLQTVTASSSSQLFRASSSFSVVNHNVVGPASSVGPSSEVPAARRCNSDPSTSVSASTLDNPIPILPPACLHPTRRMYSEKIRVLQHFIRLGSLAAVSSHLQLRSTTIIQFMCDIIVNSCEIDWALLRIPQRDEEAIMKLLPSMLTVQAAAQALALPFASLAAMVARIKRQVREECSNDHIALVLNRFLHEQWKQQQVPTFSGVKRKFEGVIDLEADEFGTSEKKPCMHAEISVAAKEPSSLGVSKDLPLPIDMDLDDDSCCDDDVALVESRSPQATVIGNKHIACSNSPPPLIR